MRCCFFGSPNEGDLLDVKGTVFGRGEGEVELATGDVTVKVLSAMADGDVSGVDGADGDMVGVDVAIDMEVDVGEMEGHVEDLGGEGLFREVGRLVDDEVGRGGVEDDKSDLGEGSQPGRCRTKTCLDEEKSYRQHAFACWHSRC